MLLAVEALTYSYKDVSVLHDVSFHVSAGEMVMIMGPNGAGKSTLLKCINHVLRPQRGVVRVEGEDVSPWSPERRARVFGYVPQINMGTELTVFDTILLGRKPYMNWGPTRKDLQVVEEIIHQMGLEGVALRPTYALSGGELQKVMLARALAQEPRILLLDEFTNNLDIRNRIEAMQSVREIVREKEVAALVVTHEFNLALRYGSRFVVLDNGRIRAVSGREAITAELLAEVFGIQVLVVEVKGMPVVVPLSPPG